VNALRAIDEWGARTAAAGVPRADTEVAVHGQHDIVLRWASVTKLLTGVAVLVAVEEGTVDLDEPDERRQAGVIDGPSRAAVRRSRRIAGRVGVGFRRVERIRDGAKRPPDRGQVATRALVDEMGNHTVDVGGRGPFEPAPTRRRDHGE